MDCKKRAIQKLFDTKKAYGGYCVNGVYEYCYPLIDEDEVAAMIFIGNVLNDEKVLVERSLLDSPLDYASTMERSIDSRAYSEIALVLESYIKLIVLTYSTKAGKAVGVGIAHRIKEFADSNFLYELSISQIAGIFHYNEKYLGRLFKTTYNLSFREYVNIKRLEYSKKLLQFSNANIIDVSLKSGFSNVTYYNRLFKSHFGISPSQYRTQMATVSS